MTNITLPLNEEVVKKANDKLQPYGITVEEAFTKFVTDIADGHGAIEYLEIPNEETKAAFAEGEAGKLTRSNSVEELMAKLNAED